MLSPGTYKIMFYVMCMVITVLVNIVIGELCYIVKNTLKKIQNKKRNMHYIFVFFRDFEIGNNCTVYTFLLIFSFTTNIDVLSPE